MNILTIDTATQIEHVALVSGDRYSDKTRTVDVSHAATIFQSIKDAFSDIDIAFNELDLIGVGIGPGSFTGIRIAVSSARMLAQLLDVPLVGIKTHRIYAESVQADVDENIIVAFDAKKGRVFGALYKKNNNEEIEEIVEPGDHYIDYLIDNINNKKRTSIVGDGGKKYCEAIEKKILNYVQLDDFLPGAELSCLLTEKIFRQSPGDYTDISRTVPYYSRKSDAEIVKEMKRGN